MYMFYLVAFRFLVIGSFASSLSYCGAWLCTAVLAPSACAIRRRRRRRHRQTVRRSASDSVGVAIAGGGWFTPDPDRSLMNS